jgi:hypothetical protein
MQENRRNSNDEAKTRRNKRKRKPVTLPLNRITVHLFTKKDIEKDAKAIASAGSPDEIRRILLSRFLAKFHHVGTEEIAKVAFQELSRPPLDNTTLSEQVCGPVCQAFDACAPLLALEDLRTLMAWALGDGSTFNGYFRVLLLEVPDSQTEKQLAQTVTHLQRIYQGLLREEDLLFKKKIPLLPLSHQRLIRGLWLDAKWDEADGNFEGAKSKNEISKVVARILVQIYEQQAEWDQETSQPKVHP